MSGDLKFNVAGADKAITATDGTNDLYSWIMKPTGFEMFNKTGNKSILNYNSATGMLNVTGDTNLLKKTGDTMTGSLLFDAKTAERNLTWQTSTGDISFRGRQNGVFSLRDWSKSLEVFSWDGTTFSVNADTNLLKKTGDAMTGDLKINKIVRYQNREDKSVAALSVDNNGRWYNWSDVSAKRVFMYDPATDTFTVDSANTNLLKNTGGMMTGNLSMELNDAYTNIQWRNKGANQWGFNVSPLKFELYDWKNNKSVFNYEGSNIEFKQPVKFSKDGRVDPILTPDAVADDVNFPVKAERRGNTVTLSGKVMLNAGAVGNTIANLPADMRPVSRYSSHQNSTDGTPVFVDINPNGNILFNVKGKPVYMTITYVAN
ncbi:hypothetical protein ABR763_01065 [Bacillus cereus]